MGRINILEKPMNLTTVEPFKIGSCKGYNGPVFNLPKVGDHLTVTGKYIIDVRREGGHANPPTLEGRYGCPSPHNRGDVWRAL